MFNLILIDFSWLYNRYYFTRSYNGSKEGLSEEKELENLVRRLGSFLTLVGKKYSLAKIMLVLDPPTSTLKNKELFKDYKQNRDSEAKKEVYANINRVIEVLNDTLGENFLFVTSTGYEADQVIAAFCERFNKEKSILIHSGDKDLLQLTAYENVSYSEKYEKGAFVLKTDANIFEKFKDYKGRDFTRISNNKKDILKYRTLKGDASDNIPPVFTRIKDEEIAYVINNLWVTESDEGLSLEQIEDMIRNCPDSDFKDKLWVSRKRWLRNYKIMNLYKIKGLKVKIMRKKNGDKT